MAAAVVGKAMIPRPPSPSERARTIEERATASVFKLLTLQRSSGMGPPLSTRSVCSDPASQATTRANKDLRALKQELCTRSCSTLQTFSHSVAPSSVIGITPRTRSEAEESRMRGCVCRREPPNCGPSRPRRALNGIASQVQNCTVPSRSPAPRSLSAAKAVGLGTVGRYQLLRTPSREPERPSTWGDAASQTGAN